MNTPAHLIFAAAAFLRPAPPGPQGAAARRRNLAALAGGLAPDLSFVLLVAFARLVQERELRQVFEEDYRSDLWQGIFAVDNSIPLWAALGLVALALRRPALAVFAGAGLLHLAFDLPLHNSDARPHFWPLTDRVFRSPLSYWDPALHGPWVARVEGLACLALGALLWRRLRDPWPRALVLAALALEAAPVFAIPWLLGR